MKINQQTYILNPHPTELTAQPIQTLSGAAGRGRFWRAFARGWVSGLLTVIAIGFQLQAESASEPRVLFSVENPAAYFRKGVSVEPGHSTVTLKIRAQRLDVDGVALLVDCSHYMEFYNERGYITGIYKRLNVGAEPQTFEICRSYVPEAATKISFGWGDKTETAAAYKILSVELIQEQTPWPPLGATAVPAWVAADPGPSHPSIKWTEDRGVLVGDLKEPFYPIGTYMVNVNEMEKVMPLNCSCQMLLLFPAC